MNVYRVVAYGFDSHGYIIAANTIDEAIDCVDYDVHPEDVYLCVNLQTNVTEICILEEF